MQPVLMIGCGGSGTKVVRHVRAAVQRRLMEIDWEDEIPSCWRFLGIDTPTIQEGVSEIPPLPNQDYVSIGSKHKSYPDLYRALESQAADSTASGIKRSLLSGWLPDPSRASVPLSKGAGQTRAIGRAAALDSFPRAVSDKLHTAFREIRGSRPDLDKVTRSLGYEVSGDTEHANQDPLVLVCTSIGGGTGAGISLDVVDLVRAIDPAGSHPALALFANDIFDLETRDALAANSLAFISELMAAYWSQHGQIESPLSVAGSTRQSGSGPHSVFLLSKEQHDGAAFGSTAEIYLAAGETLATWVTSAVVQEEIVDFLVANWQNYAGLNSGGYPFGESHQDGVISSFGVAKVSVGRDRFARWAEHKLARAAMDGLILGHLRHTAHREAHLTDEDWVEDLGLKYAEAVYTGSGISKTGNGGMAAATDHFASQDEASIHMTQVRRSLQEAIPGGSSMASTALYEHIKNRATRNKAKLLQEPDPESSREWIRNVVVDTCRAVSEIAAVTSLPVACAAVDAARAQYNQKNAANALESARVAAGEYHRLVEEGLTILRQASGSLNVESDRFKQAIDKIASGLAYSWRESRLEYVSNLMNHSDGELYGEMLGCLNSATKEIERSLVDEHVTEWPEAGETGISVKYHPSAIELPLEDHSGWLPHLRGLCHEADEQGIPYGDLPIDPVRYRMIAGYKDDIPPMVYLRADSYWTPGMSAPLECKASIAEWTGRFHAWADKPGSSYRRYVSEGLGDYLSPHDKYTNQRRSDHLDRIEKFRERLLAARNRSKPMMRVSASLHHAIHGKHAKESFIRQAFPFKDGHPAAAVVTEIVGPQGEEWYPALLDMPSVMLISYFDSPVHPMVITSLTEPIAAAINNYSNPEKRAYGFWQWRRSRRLDGFVPLPRLLLENMIRGFAVARLCGLVTAQMHTANEIVDLDNGEMIQFPWPPLTQPSTRADILAVLLESFSLCYGSINNEGRDKAFAAFKVLHDLGETHSDTFHHSALGRALQDGPQALGDMIDTPLLQGGTESERRADAQGYITNQLNRFEKCSAGNAQEFKTRDRSGIAQRGVPTGELADIYIGVYRNLLQTLQHSDSDEDEV